MYLRPGTAKRGAAISAGVATPLAFEVAMKGARMSIGGVSLKKSAVIGGTIGTIAIVAGITETGVRGEDADIVLNYGTAALATSIGLEGMSRISARQSASLAGRPMIDEINLGYQGLESGSPSFGLSMVKEY